MKLNFFIKLAAVVLSIASTSAWAWSPLPINFSDRELVSTDIAYSTNTVYLPEGGNAETKYPAVVILPACSGVNYLSKPTYHMWAEQFAKNGYVTILVDHYEPRGIGRPWNCVKTTQRPVREDDLIRDMYHTTQVLSSLPYVDKDKIFAIGYSLGGMTIGLASSKRERSSVRQDRPHIVAGASLYGGCSYANGRYEYLKNDTDTPLIWLMGSADTEAPARDCEWKIKRIQKDVTKFEYHIYEGATHAWDVTGMNGFSKTASNGQRVTYRYNHEITQDSIDRVLKHFAQFK